MHLRVNLVFIVCSSLRPLAPVPAPLRSPRSYPVWVDLGSNANAGSFSSGILALFVYTILLIMWLKFLVIWRVFRFWALCDGVEPPENMMVRPLLCYAEVHCCTVLVMRCIDSVL